LFPSTKRTARSDTGRSSPKTKTPACGRSQTPRGLILIPRKVPGPPYFDLVRRILSSVLISPRGRRLSDAEGHPHAPMSRAFLMDNSHNPPHCPTPLETVTYTINYGAEEAQGYRISKSDFYLPYLRLLRGEMPGATPQAAAS